jgi:hypothetical protein
MYEYRPFKLQAFTVLQAHEPKLIDANSALVKEVNALKQQTAAACQQNSMVQRIRCVDAVNRPIWERNAPSTMKYYDEYHKKLLEYARAYDAAGVWDGTKKTVEYFRSGLSQAAADFRENAQRDIQVAYRDAAAQQQALNLISTIANIALGLAAAKAGVPVSPITAGR